MEKLMKNLSISYRIKWRISMEELFANQSLSPEIVLGATYIYTFLFLEILKK